MAAILNQIELRKKFESLAKSKSFVGFAYNAANTRLNAAKNELLENFDEHIVTKEIIESSKNPSVSDSSIISKGNLTAAFGLNPGQGESQIQELRDVLQNEIVMKNNPDIVLNNNKAIYSFKIKLPTKASLEKTTSLEWTSKSWLSIIEEGVSSTLKKFIFWADRFKSGSRSTTGLQSKGNVSNVAELTPTPYLTKLFNKFKERFN